jgi:hypothetical protein
MAATKKGDDQSLKRLGGGRWQTRDERFTIEPQSGTWVLVDAEQTDDLGLPLVRGPFRSLTDAKAAVEAARGAEAPESPLAGRVKESKDAPSTKAEAPSSPARTGAPARKTAAAEKAKPEAPAEPRWIGELGPRDRGRARRLIERLAQGGIRDPEGTVRQDLTGGVPTIARIALADQLVASLPASAEDSKAVGRLIGPLVEAFDDGRDDELGVRWRLVDGDDRPLRITAADLREASKRRAAAAEEKDR